MKLILFTDCNIKTFYQLECILIKKCCHPWQLPALRCAYK